MPAVFGRRQGIDHGSSLAPVTMRSQARQLYEIPLVPEAVEAGDYCADRGQGMTGMAGTITTTSPPGLLISGFGAAGRTRTCATYGLEVDPRPSIAWRPMPSPPVRPGAPSSKCVLVTPNSTRRNDQRNDRLLGPTVSATACVSGASSGKLRAKVAAATLVGGRYRGS